jgi:hypothetical protein
VPIPDLITFAHSVTLDLDLQESLQNDMTSRNKRAVLNRCEDVEL